MFTIRGSLTVKKFHKVEKMVKKNLKKKKSEILDQRNMKMGGRSFNITNGALGDTLINICFPLLPVTILRVLPC